MRALKIAGLGCGGIVAMVVILVVSVAAHTHSGSPATTAAGVQAVSQNASTERSKAVMRARAYIVAHGGDAYRVQATVVNVELAVGQLQRSPSQASIDRLAQAAQTAHDNIDAIRTDFTYSDSGALGDAEGNILLGANDLKNAMGALVAYAGNPNAATLAHFNSQYTRAKAEWNSGTRAVWRVARRSSPPIV